MAGTLPGPDESVELGPTDPEGPAISARRILSLGTLAGIVLGAVGWAYLASSGITVTVDDEVRTTRTFASDVGAVLARLDVELGGDDRVEPALDTPLTDGLRVTVTHAKTIAVHVDGRDPVEVTAIVDTVGDVLRAAELVDLLEREARIDPRPDDAITHGGRIVIDLPVPVTIVADGSERRLETYAATVGEALDDAGVTVGDDDRVEPPRGDVLAPQAVVTVQRVEIAEDVVEVVIPHEEHLQETDELPAGHTRVEAEGEDGMRRETYAVTYVDGQETEREFVTEEVLRAATDRVMVVGAGSELVHEAQQLLTDLGYPAGPVDGMDGAQTRRALCAWRRLEGHEVSRGPLETSELDAIRATGGLPSAPYANRGVTVDRTCQVLYFGQEGRWQNVYAASTGADGLPRVGEYRIQRVREGWHTSTLYPAPTPNMYNTMYFRGAIAIHGSNSVPPHPASKGCVRVTPEVADRLFAALSVGDPIDVIGTY